MGYGQQAMEHDGLDGTSISDNHPAIEPLRALGLCKSDPVRILRSPRELLLTHICSVYRDSPVLRNGIVLVDVPGK